MEADGPKPVALEQCGKGRADVAQLQAVSHCIHQHVAQVIRAIGATVQYAVQAVEKLLILGRAAFLAPFRRSQRLRKMLWHKALGLCPKPRQGDDPPAPHTLSAT